ncbi:DENN domain-containing protein 2D [Manis javanica]|nr:DENN domain-containing protein 2D [Manis javanica]
MEAHELLEKGVDHFIFPQGKREALLASVPPECQSADPPGVTLQRKEGNEKRCIPEKYWSKAQTQEKQVKGNLMRAGPSYPPHLNVDEHRQHRKPQAFK